MAQSQAQVADAVTQMAQALASLKSDLADTRSRLDGLADDCNQGVKSVHDALDELVDKVDDLASVERGRLKQRLDNLEAELYQEGLEGGATKGAA
jgi:ABC-type transporter Mla subunit MlaD